MWIVPKNLASSHYAADMVDSKEDLTLLVSVTKSLPMLKSKPMSSLTLSRKWSQGGWWRLLCSRMLRVFLQDSFAARWTSSLEDTHANLSALPEGGQGSPIHDTCGRTSSNTSRQLGLFECSSRTSQDTSTTDLKQSSTTWEQQVIEQRGEYSRRLKLEQDTNDSEYSSWPTPRASEYKDCGEVGSKSHTHMHNRYYLCARVKDPSRPTGKLSPEWTEWLMGVPTGWTGLGCWGTE